MDNESWLSTLWLDLRINGEPLGPVSWVTLILGATLLLMPLLMTAETWRALRRRIIVLAVAPAAFGIVAWLVAEILNPAFGALIAVVPLAYAGMIPGMAIAGPLCALRVAGKTRAREQTGPGEPEPSTHSPGKP